MYPFNINTNGELIEVSNKGSSLDTYNDEDAMIIYDEHDQEDTKSLDLNNEGHKNSNLFNSSFFSDLSSVHKAQNKNEANIQIEKDFEDFLNNDDGGEKLHLADEENHMSNHNSFLDQELNIESIHLENEQQITQSDLAKKQDKNHKNIIESSLGLFDDETG